MSPREMGVLLDAYAAQYKEDMNFKRWQTFIMIQPYTDKIKKPEDLMKFTWDIDDKLSADDIQKRKEKLLRIINIG